MNIKATLELEQQHLSLDHEKLAQVWINTPNILIIQDLDGVCMGLVKDPRQRVIAPEYVQATRAFLGHFYVLTNGEHIGSRGVNGIVAKAFAALGKSEESLTAEGLYLPGLGAGGVQWQDIYGNISHPGVTEKELQFLKNVPELMKSRLNDFWASRGDWRQSEALETVIQAAVLDNLVSPTLNLNSFWTHLADQFQVYQGLQQEMLQLMEELQSQGAAEGLPDSFFYHLAPNLGRDSQGKEVLRLATDEDSGTTDFQYMLRGAIKEAGVLAILNRYYYQQTGEYPLGPDFNVRQAPSTTAELLQLVQENFAPELMPTMIGVGDTVNSTVIQENGAVAVKRGGSDRNFLQLIQDLGRQIERPNLIVYVDSSQGEVKNRKPVKIVGNRVVEGPGDSRDIQDPLQINVVFPGGYQQYCQFFQRVAKQRDAIKS